MAKIHRRETRRWRNSFLLSAIFGIPAMIIMMAFMYKWKNHEEAPQVMRGLSLENLIMFLLSTPVQVPHILFSFSLFLWISFHSGSVVVIFTFKHLKQSNMVLQIWMS